MSRRTVAFLLAELAVVVVIIFWELRRHRGRPFRLQFWTLQRFIRVVALPGLVAAALTLIGLLFFGRDGGAVGLALAVLVMLWSYFRGGRRVLARCGARPVTNRNLIEDARALAANAGISPPRLFETQELHPNIFALGSTLGETSIVLTLGLRHRLSNEELHAVIGREISHIASRNTLNVRLSMTLLGAVGILAQAFGLLGIAVPKKSIRAFLFTTIFAPPARLVLYLAAPPAQEFQADRNGAILCGDSDDLIRALVKLDGATRRRASITANDQPALAALFLVDPLPDTWIGRLFADHPPISERVERLKEPRLPRAQIASPLIPYSRLTSSSRS
ncbi:MAG TPA: M48 family metalloprotease [Xanthobacteraceae bacterium]